MAVNNRALAALLSVLVLGAPTITFAEPDPIMIVNLRVTHDEAVTDFRWICVNDNAPRTIAGSIERGFVTPTVEQFCQAAAEEAAKRNQLDALYARFDAERPLEIWQTIMQAAVASEVVFHTESGQAFALTCPLAFEAGFRYGRVFPERDLAPDVTESWLIDARERCFQAGSRLNRSDAVVLGSKWALRR